MRTFAQATRAKSTLTAAPTTHPSSTCPQVRNILRGPRIQPKLRIGAANEREADEIADRVMRTPDPTVAPTSAPLGLQRLCAECEEDVQRQPTEEEELLQTKEVMGPTPTVTPSVASKIASLRGRGQSLPPTERAFFEPRFGRVRERDQASARPSPFPHEHDLQSRLGKPMPDAAVIDPVGCAARGVEAFTDGSRSHFASPIPRLEVAAHEATHQLQHRGLTRDHGLGAEGHAQAVAGTVVADRSAASLIGPDGRAVPAAVRPYTEIPPPAQMPGEWDAGGGAWLRVADDGMMAVSQDSAKGSHHFWANERLVADSNAALVAANSILRLNRGGTTLSGTPPFYAALGTPQRSDLVAVEPRNIANKTKATTMDIWADCARAARGVMGAGGWPRKLGAYTGSEQKNHVSVTWIEDGETVRTSSRFHGEMADKIIEKAFPDGGWDAYHGLPPAERDEFDRMHGINEYVAPPEIGEGFLIEGDTHHSVPNVAIHMAAVVMSSGADLVTLDNFSVGQPSIENSDWNFQMYGPGGQTFHEQHAGDLQHGTAPTTLKVEKR